MATPICYYVYSHKFSHFLKTSISYTLHDYMERLIRNENKVAELGLSYIDIVSNDSISYAEIEKLKKIYVEEIGYKENVYSGFSTWLSIKSKTPEFWKQNRVEMKVGRFIKRFLPGVTDREAEEFTNIFKSYVDQFNYVFEIVGGEEILKYYNKDNYDCGTNSSLYKSCMGYNADIDLAYKKANEVPLSDRLKFYSENENCALLVLKLKDSKKIKGRCLIWKTTDNKIYMDRVYVDFESDFFLYRKYATDHNYYSHIMGNRPISGMEVKSNKNIETMFGKTTKPTAYLDTFGYSRSSNRILWGK